MDNPTRSKMEKLLEMGGGYVLDFSNNSFSDFVETSLGFRPYERYGGSKANVLRQIWVRESAADVARLNVDLLEHWRLNALANGRDLTPFESQTYGELTQIFATGSRASETATEFLARDLGAVDLRALPTSLTTANVVQARLSEIESCLAAGAPLAVIFLVGSTLEGLLSELAMQHAAAFTSCPSAPRLRNAVKPLPEWTLAELIIVSRSLGVVGEDVLKHADHVRNFRNYIHPRQQLRENFEPRMHTAEIARQVLLAALSDLRSIAEISD